MRLHKKPTHESASLQSGFTLIELLLVMGILAVLVGISSINLLQAHRNAILASTLDTLFADVKQQQIKAMVGDTENGTSTGPHGVYFTDNSYTLFQGSSYNPSEESNFLVELPEVLEFGNNTLTNSTLIFNRVNGSMTNYSPTTNSITLHNTQNEDEIVIRFNRLGIIYQAN